ncbi:MAG: RNase adapter RapZ [Syntrophobacterales bacterium]|jgi:UPF0042 nucleotide-binding protein|nr:RNase adapter RapZ [Syntrophobacterales bacterium]
MSLDQERLRVVVITGLSGSGKSTVMRSLEDIGFYCVDNLPVALLPEFLHVQSVPELGITRVALVMDLRERSFLEQYHRIFSNLKEKGYVVEILFLDAAEEALVNRFGETRRVHPLSPRGTVLEGIRLEREKLLPLKEMADRVIDTTFLNVHELRRVVQKVYDALGGEKVKKLLVRVMSFGYRYGVPLDANIVFDVRFMANPYFVPQLKLRDGHDRDTQDYVLAPEESRKFVEKMTDMIEFLLPHYEKEGKSTICIAFGCTGGRHRSVVIANQLCRFLGEQNYPFSVFHRDIGKI